MLLCFLKFYLAFKNKLQITFKWSLNIFDALWNIRSKIKLLCAHDTIYLGSVVSKKKTNIHVDGDCVQNLYVQLYASKPIGRQRDL